MIDVKRRLLTNLRESTILAATACTLANEPAELRIDVTACHVPELGRRGLCTQPEKGQELREIHEAFSLCAFRIGQSVAAVLTIEQLLQPLVKRLGQPQAIQLVWPGQFYDDALRHVSLKV